MRDIVENLMRLAADDVRRYARARQRNAMLYAVAGVAGLTAYVCLVAAGVLLVARWSDPVLAATFAAAAFAALALIVIAVVSVLNRRERQWMEERRAVYTNTVRTLSGAALGSKGMALVSAVMMAGMVMGKTLRRPRGPIDETDPRL